MIRVRGDRDVCVGAGMCVLTAPAVFDQDEDEGLVVVRDPAPLADQDEAVRMAEQTCPSGAITVWEE